MAAGWSLFSGAPLAAQQRAGGAPPPPQKAGAAAAQFTADPMWPKPLPNGWILGSVTGVAVDAQDHVWIVHRGLPSLTARTEAGTGTVTPVAVEGKAGADGQRTADVRLSVPLRGSKPGRYLLDLSASLPGGAPIRRLVAIEIR